jgi:ribosome maturation protein SDO1
VIYLVVSIDKAVVARLRIGQLKFEILVDPEKAFELKSGKVVRMEDILAYPMIYKDARTGEAASEKDVQNLFGTTDVYKVAERIIKEGELQLTTEQRRRLVEQKKIQIANIISKKAINPQTNTPHPQQRILNAMEQVGVNVDPFLDAEMQVENVLKKIKTILPIKFQKLLIQVKVPSQFSSKVYNFIKSAGSIQQEQWLPDGSLQLNVEIFAGAQEEFFKKLADATHGQAETKIVRREDV